jgi:hypothetical protein
VIAPARRATLPSRAPHLPLSGATLMPVSHVTCGLLRGGALIAPKSWALLISHRISATDPVTPPSTVLYLTVAIETVVKPRESDNPCVSLTYFTYVMDEYEANHTPRVCQTASLNGGRVDWVRECQGELGFLCVSRSGFVAAERDDGAQLAVPVAGSI